MRWERLGKVAAAALVCLLAACGGGGGDASTSGVQSALKAPAGGPPGLVGNDRACAAILGKGKGQPPAHVREACGDGQPTAPVPTLAPAGLAVSYATKSYGFSWSPLAEAGITRYELLEDRDGAGPLAPATVASSTTTAVTLQLGLLHERVNADYAVRACNAAGCGPASAAVRPDVTRVVGTVQAAVPGALEHFGAAIALSADGSTLAVGSPQENNVLTSNPQPALPTTAGGVYVFTRGAAGWVQQAHLHSSRPGVDSRFGSTVALSADGTTLAAGSAADRANGYQSGSVDVFVRSGAGWAHQAYLVAGNPGALHQFGSALSMSADGNTLAVGAFTENNPAAGTYPPNPMGATSPVGAVYVFSRSAGAWTQQAHITHPQPTLADGFGNAVALSSDGATLAVGTSNRSVGGAAGAGVVYVFQRGTTAWTQQAMLSAPAPAAYTRFGHSVALSSDGNTLAAGALGPVTGAAYVFRRSGTAWSQQAVLQPHNPESGDSFGVSVALSGDGTTLAVGNPAEDGSARWFGNMSSADENGILDPGAVYVFQLNGGSWSQTGYLKPGSDDRDYARFGNAVAMSRDGTVLGVGALMQKTPVIRGGAAYLF